MSRTDEAGIAQVRPQLVIWILAALCVLRAVAAFLPTGYVWGVSYARDVAPALAWPLVLLACASVAAGGRTLARLLTEADQDPIEAGRQRALGGTPGLGPASQPALGSGESK